MAEKKEKSKNNKDDFGVLKYKNGSIRYVGNFSGEGIAYGNGKLYREDGSIIYEGGFELSKYHGDGKLYHNDGSIMYEGEFKSGRYEGNGKFYFEGGSIMYEGEFKSGRYEGNGKFYFEGGSIKYEGKWKEDEYHGQGIEYNEPRSIPLHNIVITAIRNIDNIKYKGEFYFSKFQGLGKLHTKMDDIEEIYTGYFDDNKYNGKGTLKIYKEMADTESGPICITKFGIFKDDVLLSGEIFRDDDLFALVSNYIITKL